MEARYLIVETFPVDHRASASVEADAQIDMASATPDGLSPAPIAYIMSRFPKLTETFVLFELMALERQGAAMEVFPLLCAGDCRLQRSRQHYRFCNVFVPPMLKSTRNSGVSMAQRSAPRDVLRAVEKRGFGETGRPRVRPFSRGLFDKNPSPLRWRRQPVALPFVAWCGYLIVAVC